MTFGQIIKQLRQKANLTQEQLAETLCISGQAVSRWENNSAMPDISLLPILANLFDVTTDYLLGVDITRKQEKINAICERAHAKGSAGYKKEAVEIARAGLKEYPQSYLLMNCLQTYLADLSYQYKVEKRIKAMEEVVALCERILDGCTEDAIRYCAVDSLIKIYPALGKEEKAQKLAQSMPEAYLNRKSLLAKCLQGAEQYHAKRDALVSLLNASICGFLLLNTQLEDGTSALSYEAEILMYQNALALIDMICPDGDDGPYYAYRVDAYVRLGFAFLQKGESQTGLEYLKEAAELAIAFDQSYDAPQKEHTSLLLCGRSKQNLNFDSPNNQAFGVLHALRSSPCFPEIKATEEGKALLCRLEEYAGKRKSC